MSETYYHGTQAVLVAGDLIEPGWGGSRHEYAYASRSLRHASDFAREGEGGRVYVVEATGPYECVPLARGEVRSRAPWRVLNELPLPA